MEEIKLHAFGETDYFESLKRKYDLLKYKIQASKKLSEIEKKSKLESLAKSFEKEKKDLKSNLY